MFFAVLLYLLGSSVLLWLLWTARRQIISLLTRVIDWIRGSSDTFLAIVSLVITLVYGAWGVHLSNRQIAISEKQDSTSISLDTFKSLLLKTDRLISLQSSQLPKYDKEIEELKTLVGKTDTVVRQSTSQSKLIGSQLELSVEQQKEYYRKLEETRKSEEFSSITELSKLQIHSTRLNTALTEYAEAKKKNDYQYFYNVKNRITFTNNIESIMSQALDNKELHKNRRLVSAWRLAYARLLIEQTTHDLFIQRSITYVDDIRLIEHFIRTMDKVTSFCYQEGEFSLNRIIELEKANGVYVDTSSF